MSTEIRHTPPNPFDPFCNSNSKLARRFCRHLHPLWQCNYEGCKKELREVAHELWKKKQECHPFPISVPLPPRNP